MFFDQNSFSEFTSNIFGQVLLAVQRASRPSVLPVIGSSTTSLVNGPWNSETSGRCAGGACVPAGQSDSW